jgi:two-component system phosphate regulon sensor histidine kinase PhoR
MILTAAEAIAVAFAAAGGFAAGWLVRRSEAGEPRATPPPDVTLDDRFEDLLASITVGVILVDARGQILAMNPAASVIFELGSKSFLGRAVIEAIPSFEIDRRVRAALRGNPSRGTVELKGVPRSRRLAVTVVPFENDTGAILVVSDETRLHDLEESRREFVANLSHELRTPLSSVKLMIETLVENDADPAVRAMFLPRVEAELDRMVQLVQDMLELARAEAGWLKLRRERVDLEELTRSILTRFEARAVQADVEMRFEGRRAYVDSDPERLAQVVVNLVDNALRHTPDGGIVTVAVRIDGQEARLIVEDTGEGIPFNDLPYIFDRFYVVERSRARAASGTGLGLSIVKHIVEAHGGSVSVESEFGFGATFTCRFPASVPQVAELPGLPARSVAGSRHEKTNPLMKH